MLSCEMHHLGSIYTHSITPDVIMVSICHCRPVYAEEDLETRYEYPAGGGLLGHLNAHLHTPR